MTKATTNTQNNTTTYTTNENSTTGHKDFHKNVSDSINNNSLVRLNYDLQQSKEFLNKLYKINTEYKKDSQVYFDENSFNIAFDKVNTDIIYLVVKPINEKELYIVLDNEKFNSCSIEEIPLFILESLKKEKFYILTLWEIQFNI